MNAPPFPVDRWTPASWRSRPARQLPDYDDRDALDAVEERLRHAAPVVAIDDCRRLRRAVERLANGAGVLLQGGDCAESFDDQVAMRVADLAGLFDRMAVPLRAAANGRG
jgi:3-deoxy-7-phosphoheptulonate synthase